MLKFLLAAVADKGSLHILWNVSYQHFQSSNKWECFGNFLQRDVGRLRKRSQKILTWWVSYYLVLIWVLGWHGEYQTISINPIWTSVFAYTGANTSTSVLKKLDFSQLWVWKRAVCFLFHEDISFQREKIKFVKTSAISYGETLTNLVKRLSTKKHFKGQILFLRVLGI